MPCGVFRWTLVYFSVYTDRVTGIQEPKWAKIGEQ